MRLFTALISVFLMPVIAWAECKSTGCYDVYVDQVYVKFTGNNLVQTSGDETLVNCTANSGIFLEIDNAGNYKEILSTLLAAQMADKKVTIRIIEGSPNCKIAYVTLNRQ